MDRPTKPPAKSRKSKAAPAVDNAAGSNEQAAIAAPSNTGGVVKGGLRDPFSRSDEVGADAGHNAVHGAFLQRARPGWHAILQRVRLLNGPHRVDTLAIRLSAKSKLLPSAHERLQIRSHMQEEAVPLLRPRRR